MKPVYLKELLTYLSGYEIVGNGEGFVVSNFKPIKEADVDSLVWIKSSLADKYEIVKATPARVIICSKDFIITADLLEEKVFIRVDDPKLEFLRLVAALTEKKVALGIHPTAFVEKTAKIHPESWIGPFSYIGSCEIGQGTVITGHCHIHDGTSIGKNVLIHAGAVIGSDGYGYSRNPEMKLEKFPHIGGVVIEDDVEIGANTCIDRGTLGNTLIREGAKIDNLVHIAHNVIVGKHAAVIANAMIGGSTVIDDYAWIAPSASLMNGIVVGKGATAGLGAVVTKNIPDGETWAGAPARPLESFIRLQNELKKLL